MNSAHDPFLRFVQEFIDAGDIPILSENEPLPPHKGLKYVPVIEKVDLPVSSLLDAREHIRIEIEKYGDLKNPGYMLVVAPAPGIGKSYAAVREAERQAERYGRKVLFAGPRHNLFPTLLDMAPHPEWWYEFQPRKLGNPETGEGLTCQFTDQVAKWTNKGYRGIKFCEQICKWDFIQNGCVYHAQKKKQYPITYGMHQHVFLGHPMEFDFLIGDEYPINATLHQWLIPNEFILPARTDMFDNSPATEILKRMANLAEKHPLLLGRKLIEELGGSETLIRSISDILFTLDDKKVPTLGKASDSEKVPYGHVKDLMKLLRREAIAAQGEGEYINRVILDKGRLMMLLRRDVDARMPEHCVWLDGTAQPHLYEAVFGRPVKVIQPHVKREGKVFQVTDRAYGKHSLVEKNEEGEDADITHRAKQARQVVDRIVKDKGYKNPAVFTFLKVEPVFEGYVTGHFGAETGDNSFENCDALFVVGTPLPSHYEMQKQAAMIFHERMTAFQTQWTSQDVQYEGHNLAYSVGDFWHDDDLRAVAQQSREASIVQAAHRSRMNIRKVDVWLFTNIPMASLPPDELLTVRQIVGAPQKGVNLYMWNQVLQAAERMVAEKGYVTSHDLVDACDISTKTASHYINELIKQEGWEEYKAATKTRGRAPRAIQHSDDYDLSCS